MKTIEERAEELYPKVTYPYYYRDYEMNSNAISEMERMAYIKGRQEANAEWEKKWDTSINFDKQVIAESAAEQAWKECNAEWQEKIRWKNPEDELPEYIDTEVEAILEWDSGKSVRCFLKFVYEDDCIWRTIDDNGELSYSIRVVKWREIIE